MSIGNMQNDQHVKTKKVRQKCIIVNMGGLLTAMQLSLIFRFSIVSHVAIFFNSSF